MLSKATFSFFALFSMKIYMYTLQLLHTASLVGQEQQEIISMGVLIVYMCIVSIYSA